MRRWPHSGPRSSCAPTTRSRTAISVACCWRKNNVAEALKHLQEAVRLDPANPRSLLGFAEALAARGDYDVAVEMLERAMKLPLSEDLAKEIFARRAEYLKLRKG